MFWADVNSDGRPLMTRSGVKPLAGVSALLLLTYLVALIAMAPAASVWKLLEPRLDLPVAVQVQELSGSFWNGRAGSLRVEGRDIGNLAWRWRPMALLKGQLGLRLHWQAGTDEADLLLRLRRGTAQIIGLRGTLDASRLQPWFDLPMLLRGRVDLEIARIRWEAGAGFQQADGTVLWADAAAGLPRPLALGLYRAEVDILDGSLLARIEASPESPLEVRGTASWHPSGSHRLDLSLRSGSQTDPHLHSALDAIARRQPDGSHRLLLEASGSSIADPAADRSMPSRQVSPRGQTTVSPDIDESETFFLP